MSVVFVSKTTRQWHTMSLNPCEIPVDDDPRPMAEAVIALTHTPTAVVTQSGEIVASNVLWTGRKPSRMAADGPRRLEESLPEWFSMKSLTESMQLGYPPVGHRKGVWKTISAHNGRPHRRRASICWSRLPLHGQSQTLTIISVSDELTTDDLVSLIGSQRAHIDQLLIRQTLVEEAERRRLGQSLHDVVAQDLAELNSDLLRCSASAVCKDRMQQKLKQIIAAVRDMSFEISPPVLEDLGLLPAVHWLSDHVSQRYCVCVTAADDGVEPDLSPEARIIMFRALRELVINAAKYASEHAITITSSSSHDKSCVEVADRGPGLRRSANDKVHYGLLSVEQQIRGIGGSFEISARKGEGTLITITIPKSTKKNRS
ncbi:MAG: hypothetical protein RLN76_05880 [Phycisphaeraceae bacterium]